MLKMIAMVAPVRSLPGRSTGTTHCRHCSEYETLPHVLGSCPQGQVLRIKRYNTIRSMIADALRSKNLDVHEEVHCIADGGSNRRIDIIAINRNKQTAEIIDPTIRFLRAHDSVPIGEIQLRKNHSYRSLLRSERHHPENLLEEENVEISKVEGKVEGERKSVEVEWKFADEREIAKRKRKQNKKKEVVEERNSQD
ncbi:hypothetical protein ANN_25677 [Periplaneta americana]|uniref:Reverse transcriptase n=1 Tax=Periplaneta americana TaxID=6978 RepID=A0ABQ8S3U4_PERAM|nr:hypothetical protein ANN_25677 [Periplaneta americana]